MEQKEEEGEEMNRDNWSGMGVGLGVGILVGALLGILFAPQSGKETRKAIKTKANQLRDRVTGKFKKRA